MDPADQGQLEGVRSGCGTLGARVRRGTVPGRVDMPGDDERIEAAQEGLDDGRVGVAPRRQEHRDRSGCLELPDVPAGTKAAATWVHTP